MTPGRLELDDLSRALAELEPVLAAGDLAAALVAAAAFAAGRTHSAWAAIAIVERGEITGEGWFPAAEAVDAETRQRFHRAARGGEADADLRTLACELGPSGSVVLGLPAVGADRRAALAPLFRVVALRLHALHAAIAGENTRRQYERWFRTMDEQVRVLDRERQKFAAVVQQSDSCVFVADHQHNIRWTNTVMRQKLTPRGASGEWIGESCRAMCSQMGQDGKNGCTECPIERAFQENQIVHREFRWERAKETQHHYLTALPIRDTEGRPLEVMVTVQDLGDLGMLRRSEARYRMLFERSNKGILLIEPASGRILHANPMASRMTGFSRDELTAMSLPQLHTPAERARLESIYTAAMRQRTLEPRECRILARDGSERIAMMAGARYDLGDQDVLMLDLQDVTERRRVEEALRRAEASLSTVISHAPIVLFSTDAQGVFTMSEGRGLESLGLKPGEVVGRSVFDVYESVPEVLDLVRRALGGAEFTASSAVGPITFETHYTPTRDAAGRVSGMIGVAIDVTDRRRLEEQLVHSQKMEAIGRLAGGVAHDFNNLLAAILGHCEMMLAELDAGHPLRDGVEEIHRAGGRGALLTRQLLAFSRRDVPAPECLDLRAVVHDLDALLRRLIGEDIELVLDLAPRACIVRADRAQLEQTVLNLVVNARDAMPEGGRIAIAVADAELTAEDIGGGAAARPGPYVRLAVTDDGTGMNEEVLAHAFEPFYTTKEQGKGTGLGLSTVYGIAERNRGCVKATSRPGQGSTFEVWLPRSEGTLVEEPLVDDSGPVRGGHETILLVEDEPAVRDLVREALAAQGYEVLVADGGPTALKISEQREGTLDLLLTDVVMPRMGGGELATRLREKRPGLRVIFMSGYTDDAVVRHGVFESRVAFLQKPFRLEDLARKVREVLDAPLAAEATRDAA